MRDIHNNKMLAGEAGACDPQEQNQGSGIKLVEITADNMAHILALLKNKKLVPAVYNPSTSTIYKL